ncbi:aminotransferase-like domain-containing protein [Vibrio atypicus]|uniref:aminotransferase-like domain-containing protein n=1 Tax=Vibrio atypicus TaxID=558271 RepID=UPI003736F2B9
MNRYQQLADDIKQQIMSNTWRAGEKIPSVRVTSRNYSVSAATVLQAYQLLESEGWLTAKPQSGYFVTSVIETRVKQPALEIRPAYNDDLYEFLQSNTVAQVSFGSPLPDPQLFPFDSLTRHLASAGRKMSSQSIIQDLPPGNESLRRLIAQRYLSQGVVVSAEDIVITSGAMEALNLSVQVTTQVGEQIVIESPAFYGAIQAAKRHHLTVNEVQIDPVNGLCLHALEEVFKAGAKACWLMPNFHNPTGITLSDEVKQSVVKLANQYQVMIVEDDVYSELYFEGDKPKPLKYWDNEDRVLLCGSFSKSLCPGYRIGWVVNRTFNKRLQKQQLISTLSGSSPIQQGIAHYLQFESYDSHLRKLRKTLSERMHQLSHKVRQTFPKEAKVYTPAGGYFIWVELPETIDSYQMSRQLFEDGISIGHGSLFSTQQQYQHCLRINASCHLEPMVDKAVSRIGELIQKSEA